MSKTLLAVDDSATIRKALEITFGGEGYRVIAADSRTAALARLADRPDLILIDTVLGNDDGYALCQEVRTQAPDAAIVLLSSRFNPYDTQKGQAAGADDYSDKPFDTQQLLDKARAVLEARANGGGAASFRGTAPATAAPSPTATPANAIPAARSDSHPPSQPAGRAQTLVFGASPINAQTVNPYATGAAKPAGPPPVPARPAVAPIAQPPAAPPQQMRAEPPRPSPTAVPPTTAPTAAPAAPRAEAVAAPTTPPSAAVQGAVADLAGKLDTLGLTKEQISAVVALSHEVVERVVWEVVPQLAETLIREEIQRLTKE